MVNSIQTTTSAVDEMLFEERSVPMNFLCVGFIKIKDKRLQFYYLHDTFSLCVLPLDRSVSEVKQSYLPVWVSPVNIIPLKIKRSKNLIRFYFSKDKKITSIKLSLETILTEFIKQGRMRDFAAERKAALERASENPILNPSMENRWESYAVFNAGAIYLNDKVHFVYRAVGESGLSVFGYASSSDGIHIEERSEIPAFVVGNLMPKHIQGFTPYPYLSGGSWWGCEDPRLTVLEDSIIMTFTVFDGINPPCVAITTISVDDFLNKRWNWEKPKIISEPGKINKNWVVFPEKINGRFAILHSLSPEVAIEFRSTIDFEDGEFVKSSYSPKKWENCWDNWIRGVGAPPIKTEKGWLVLYHAMDRKDPDKYKLGAMLLDKTNPTKILSRTTSPLLEPNEWYENNGHKKGVIYNCGAVIMGEKLLVYYGGSDTYLCESSMNLKSLISNLSSS